jgi:hypothetical protein
VEIWSAFSEPFLETLKVKETCVKVTSYFSMTKLFTGTNGLQELLKSHSK